MFKFFSTSNSKWIDPKDFNSNECNSNSSKGWVLEVDLEYPKKLRELHNDYPLPPDRIEIKKEMQSNYQLKIADFCNITVGTLKNEFLTFLIKKRMCSIMKTFNFKSRIEAEKCVLEFNKSQWLKTYLKFITHRIEV